VKDGVIGNDTRIVAALPTLRLALQAGASVIIMSHLGRPEEGLPISEQPELSLEPVARRLEELLGSRVRLVQDYLERPEAVVPAAGELLLLENVRINRGEKS